MNAPDPPAGWLERPDLMVVLDRMVDHRLTLVTAGPGCGKTTSLAIWAKTRTTIPVVWVTLGAADAAAEILARRLCAALRRRFPGIPADLLTAARMSAGPQAGAQSRAAALAGEIAESLITEGIRDLVLILDDVHEVGAPGLLEELWKHAPEGLHLVLLSRTGPPFGVQRLRGLGEVLDVPGGLLAFTPAETARLAQAELGDADAGNLAALLHKLTSGWPVAVRLALTWLHGHAPGGRRDRLGVLTGPIGPLFDYLAEEVLGTCDERLRGLLGAVAPLPWFTSGLCTAIGIPMPEAELARIAEQRILLTRQPDAEARYTVTPLARDCLQGSNGRDTMRRAGQWYEAEGFVSEALKAAELSGDAQAGLALLNRHWRALLSEGRAAEVARACAEVPDGLRTQAIELAEGQARQVQGDWPGALRCLRRADGDDAAPPPEVAWRMGMIHYYRGDYRTALEVFERGRRADDGPPPATVDEGVLLAWTASARWMLGDVAAAARMGERARAAAEISGDDQTAASAHTALAMVAHEEGDRAASERHSGWALAAAERAGDVLLRIRIYTNRASHRTEEARYPEALQDLEAAIRLAELAGAPVNLGIALHNRGEAMFALGRLDEAVADFDASRDLLSRLSSDKVGHPLMGLGHVYRERGDAYMAQARYEDALEHGERLEDGQLIQRALAGLARSVAGTDPDRAARLAGRAVELGAGSGHVGALLAAGWVALACGDRSGPAEYARSARTTAAQRRDRAGHAEALELAALAADARDTRGTLLAEAAGIWAEIGSPVPAARNALATARLTGGERAAAEAAQRRLHRLGVREGGGSCAGLLGAVTALDRRTVRVCLLGGFQVYRDGLPVPAQEWQSKKARDLLALLICRRGGRVTREEAMEALWPETDPARCRNRLSVALSAVRGVLDPGRLFAADEFVRADQHSIAVTGVRSDIQEFLDAAGLALNSGAVDLLVAADARYLGHVCEDDPYSDWAGPLRDEARAVHRRVLRELYRLIRAAGEHDRAVGYLLRLLESDEYDEAIHLELVETLTAARRHGEARRRYRVYARRMTDLGIEAVPFP